MTGMFTLFVSQSPELQLMGVCPSLARSHTASMKAPALHVHQFLARVEHRRGAGPFLATPLLSMRERLELQR